VGLVVDAALREAGVNGGADPAGEGRYPDG
jgi:hypothetical protein